MLSHIIFVVLKRLKLFTANQIYHLFYFFNIESDYVHCYLVGLEDYRVYLDWAMKVTEAKLVLESLIRC